MLGCFSRVRLFATLWLIAHQAPLSMEFSRQLLFGQEQWTGFPCSPPGDIPNPWIEPVSLTSPALADRLFIPSTTWEAQQLPRVSASQSCLTLCNLMDCGSPGSSVPGILQARILEWVAISVSTGSSRPRDRTWVSHVADRFFTVWAPREAR